MRTAEWINTVAFLLLTVLAWLRPLESPKRRRATSLGAAGLLLTLVSAGIVPKTLHPLPSSVVRDWFPYPLVLLFYWQAGQFFTRANVRAERRLESMDVQIVVPLLAWFQSRKVGRSLLAFWEAAYLFCYPSLPLGLVALYLMHRGSEADRYWSIVVVSTYTCYAALPFFQTRPPRSIGKANAMQPPLSPVRRLNLLVLRHASIQVNTFPSAHVAGATACALALLTVSPPIGFAFLALAGCIALGAALGRYHYAGDVVAGALVALIVFLLEAGTRSG